MQLFHLILSFLNFTIIHFLLNLYCFAAVAVLNFLNFINVFVNDVFSFIINAKFIIFIYVVMLIIFLKIVNNFRWYFPLSESYFMVIYINLIIIFIFTHFLNLPPPISTNSFNFQSYILFFYYVLQCYFSNYHYCNTQQSLILLT